MNLVKFANSVDSDVSQIIWIYTVCPLGEQLLSLISIQGGVGEGAGGGKMKMEENEKYFEY